MGLIDRLIDYIEKHKQITWILLLGYIIFNGCFVFPFSNELFPFSMEKGLMVITGYGIIGMCFAGVLNKNKIFVVFMLTFCFTGIGMICRYFLEYGEVSNTMNFVPINIILFLIMVPVYCVIIYCTINKLKTK